jgi:hypothetical protein
MADEPKKKKHSVAIRLAPPWGFFWLFSIGFFKLSFWQGVWAIVIWPYYVGDWVRMTYFN